MCKILAKSNEIELKKHIAEMFEAIEKLNFDKIKIENISKEKFKELLKYAIFFHDLGKVSPVFQQKVGNREFETENLDFPDIRHNILSLFFINKEKVKKICGDKENLYATFLSAIAFHHWKKDEKDYLLHINDDLFSVCKILVNGEGEKLAEKLKEHFRNFNSGKLNNDKPEDLISFDKELAEHIKEGGNLTSAGIIPPYSLYFLPERMKEKYEKNIDLNLWVLLSGFLMRIDHFVSFVEREKSGINIEQIEKSVSNVNVLEKLKQDKNLDKNLWQEEILKDCKYKNTVLIAPTGIGKTEFALAWADGEKIFYTLPLRVATNQIFERACGYFNEESKNEEDPYINGNVGLLHSDADLYLLDRSEISKGDNSFDGETLKILDLVGHFSLPINICTGDQIFPSALKYPGYEKVYATLGYSRLIIDEVQAYDPKACAIVIKTIEDIVSLGGKFLLMTATLPKFVEEYLKNSIKDFESQVEVIDFYGKIRDIVRHKIQLKNNNMEDDLDVIIEKANTGKRILVVVNTVEKAEQIYKELGKNIKDTSLELIHSRFTLNERKLKEKNLQEKFKNPKSEDEKEGKILVATQVVEASLDIDADYLFTEIAPIDSLIQRMGRVMRRVDLRSGKIKNLNKDFGYKDFYPESEPNIYIYYQKEEKKGNVKILESGKGKVYPETLLERTLEKLNQKSELSENEKQKLVEELYRKEEIPEYLEEFYRTISILNSGYVSENRDEAHNIFREIFTIPLIEENKIEDITGKINQKRQNNQDISWLWFKKEIIAEYVINDNMRKYKEYELKSLWDTIKDKIIGTEINKKIEKYCQGIWCVKNIKTSSESKAEEETESRVI